MNLTRSIYALSEIASAYRRVNEALTIPENAKDEVEMAIRKGLPRNYKYGDFIIRWYRNDKARLGNSPTAYSQLVSKYISNLPNTIDLLKSYDEYVQQLRSQNRLPQTVDIPLRNGQGSIKVNPITDFAGKIRSVEGAQALVARLGDILYTDTAISTEQPKFAFGPLDRANIRLIGFTENVMCWATKGYETTNKFVFHLWQNAKTLGRGDVYGDPTEQTPYCTHSKNHWDNYAEDDENYQQFWYLKRVEHLLDHGSPIHKTLTDSDISNEELMQTWNNINAQMKTLRYEIGDLNNANTVKVFNLMKGSGSQLLIAMNDSGDDFLDRNDSSITVWRDGVEVPNFDRLEYGSEVQQLDKNVFITADAAVIDDDYGTFVRIGAKRMPAVDANSQEGLSKQQLIDRLASDLEWCKKYILSDAEEFGVAEDGTPTAKYDWSDIGKVLRTGDGAWDADGIKRLLEGNYFDLFYNDADPDYDLHYCPAKDWFDKEMEQYGISWSDIANILKGREYEVETLSEYKKEKIAEICEDDFNGNGQNFAGTYSDCSISGMGDEAYKGVKGDLESNLPPMVTMDETGIVFKLDKMTLNTVISNWDNEDSDKDTFLKAYVDGEFFSVDQPYYGYSDFSNDMMQEAMESFADKIKPILEEDEPVEDAEGQQFFDFDKDYRK